VRDLIHVGSTVSGKNAPDKINKGQIIKFDIRLYPSTVFRKDASNIPKLAKPRDIKNIKGTKSKKETLILKPNIIERNKSKIPCRVAIVAPPKHLPITTDILDIGATRISFRNPKSLSRIIDTPQIIDVKNRGRIAIPGAKKTP
jgi:hypothetical protein